METNEIRKVLERIQEDKSPFVQNCAQSMMCSLDSIEQNLEHIRTTINSLKETQGHEEEMDYMEGKLRITLVNKNILWSLIKGVFPEYMEDCI